LALIKEQNDETLCFRFNSEVNLSKWLVNKKCSERKTEFAYHGWYKLYARGVSHKKTTQEVGKSMGLPWD
jgi:hypothetical protein